MRQLRNKTDKEDALDDLVGDLFEEDMEISTKKQNHSRIRTRPVLLLVLLLTSVLAIISAITGIHR
jgi:hypothetical protein